MNLLQFPEQSFQKKGIQPDASQYYGLATSGERHTHRLRTYSSGVAGGAAFRRPALLDDERVNRPRLLSNDEMALASRKFLLDVEETMRIILEQEDTDGNFQICITDGGPKVRGTYMLSNLLQELALAKDYGRKNLVLDEMRLYENPVDRLSRMIRSLFWKNLTRTIDSDGLETICADPKNRSRDVAPRIYVPTGEPEIYEYYQKVAASKPQLNLQVERLPQNITPAYFMTLNDKPGILALAMRKVIRDDGQPSLSGIPFVVPGARFNELYNWDSYFIALGLLSDNFVDLARGIADHFCFEIQHYGKILNGNRSYYLMRSQPPFLTDLALQVYSHLDPSFAKENKKWLRRVLQSAIKEYHSVWMSTPRLDPISGLTRYRPDGRGIPPETEASHFSHILKPYAEKYGVSVSDVVQLYNSGQINEPDLDAYFMHDRAVRESGHDTSYRLEGHCANIATIDLNSLLFKYEIDIATAIRDYFDDSLELDLEFTIGAFPFGSEVPYIGLAAIASEHSSKSAPRQTSAHWFARAARRKQLIDHYLWHEEKSLFFDYDTDKRCQNSYESVTTLWALWSGCASKKQAEKLVPTAIPLFEVAGGLVAGTEASRGAVGPDRPERQWDYPAAWPPHQILAWGGLQRYGYAAEAQRLAYKWLYMLTFSFASFNGLVPEKFDAVNLSHNVEAEYGNQGTDFFCVPREGFGWMNASYTIGLAVITRHQRRALGALTLPDTMFKL